MTFPEQSRIATKATAVLIEYLRIVTLALELREDQRYEERDIKQLKELKSTLEEELSSVGSGILSSFMTLYEDQGRPWKCVPVQEARFSADHSRTFDYTELHRLAQSSRRSERNELKKILAKKGANPKDILDWTPLHYAAAKGPVDAIGILLKHQANANALDLLEWTPLHYACQSGKTSIVQNPIREGPELDVRGRDGLAPLHCAAMNGHVDVVRSLIEAGAALDVLDASRNTPLHWAAFKGHRGVVEYPWKDANKKLRDHNGRTALHLATISKRVGEGVEEDRLKVVRLLAVEEEALEAKDRVGRTPLHYAAGRGHEAVVRLLR
jgi:ankyrin repeat protein